jgi:hypothetical protein
MGAYASLEQNAVVANIGGGSAIGAINGPSIDTAGYSEAMIVLATGLAVATGTLACKIQDSADNAAFADVAGAAFAGLVATDDNKAKIGRLKLDGNLVRRYIRAVTTVGTATVDHVVLAVLSGNQYSPQTVETVQFSI